MPLAAGSGTEIRFHYLMRRIGVVDVPLVLRRDVAPVAAAHVAGPGLRPRPAHPAAQVAAVRRPVQAVLVEALVGHARGRPPRAAELRAPHGLVGEVRVQVVAHAHHQDQDGDPQHQRDPRA